MNSPNIPIKVVPMFDVENPDSRIVFISKNRPIGTKISINKIHHITAKK
jgi:hypothetical protein